MDCVSFHIQSECGKIWTRITPNADTFHAVWVCIKQYVKFVGKNLLLLLNSQKLFWTAFLQNTWMTASIIYPRILTKRFTCWCLRFNIFVRNGWMREFYVGSLIQEILFFLWICSFPLKILPVLQEPLTFLEV